MTVNATANNPQPPSNTRTAKRKKPEEAINLPPWVHPDVAYWFPEWLMIRDAIGGEKEVKNQSTLYLPPLEDMTPGEYEGYLNRATFYNFTGPTVNALVGTLLRRQPTIDGLTDELEKGLTSFTKDDQSFDHFMKQVAEEVTSHNRVGVLVDMPAVASGVPQPYATTYTAENIMWWETTEINGRDRLSKVVLRETKLINSGKIVTRWRELSLQLRPSTRVANTVEWVYVVRVFENVDSDAEYLPDAVVSAGTIAPFVETIPTVRGRMLDFIPFVILSTKGTRLPVAKPVMQDICRLNMSHYRSYADLEHGRFFTGFPIYYNEMSNQAEGGDYRIGPSRVWEVPMGSKPGILEFNGNGLKFLENALSQKEGHAAALGGRMIGVEARSTSESDNQVKLKDRNEQAILFDISIGLDVGLTVVLRWWARMRDVSAEAAEKIVLTVSKDFLFQSAGAREFRAIQSMYLDGLLPIEVFYEYMRKENVIPDWMSVDEFKTLLSNPSSFPNQPNAEARGRGYPNRQSEIDDENADLDRESKEKQAKDAAKAAAKKPAAVPGQRPAPAGGV